MNTLQRRKEIEQIESTLKLRSYGNTENYLQDGVEKIEMFLTPSGRRIGIVYHLPFKENDRSFATGGYDILIGCSGLTVDDAIAKIEGMETN